MAIYRKSYVTKHGAGYRYQRAVPEELQPIVGRKAWTKYLGAVTSNRHTLVARQRCAR
jgi:hypothetical protein